MAIQQLVLPLDTPQLHAAALHPQGLGMVTLAFRRGRRWDQLAVPVADIGEVTKMVAGQTDVYISQNRFWGRRRLTHLAQLDALFVDLDFYNVPALVDMHPLGVLELAYEALEEAKMPQPSFAVVNGKGGGAYLVWLHSPVPRQALPRWNACQRELWLTLKHLGADRRALDAARVLRLVGTVHSGTGAVVEAVTPARAPWPFDSLADEILPYTRAELHSLQAARARRKAQEPPGPVVRPPQGFTWATLWEARLSDLQRLLDLRFWRPLPPGHRDEWLFQASVAMSWLAPPLVLLREVYALAHQVGGWDEQEARSRMGAVINRCYAAARGEKIHWQGEERDPRYWLKNETMIERLEITVEEQRQLTTIWSDQVRLEKDREKKMTARRAAGVIPREEYEANSLSRLEPWKALGMSRRTWYRKGKPMPTN